MTKSAYITQYNDVDVEIHFANLSEKDYTVIIIKELNDGRTIDVPTVYLEKAQREEDEVFLKQNSDINELLTSEGLVDISNDVIQTNNGSYAHVATLTDKTKNIMSGYIVNERNEPDEISDSEFD